MSPPTDPTTDAFPEALRAVIARYLTDNLVLENTGNNLVIFDRPLWATDADSSVGVIDTEWEPESGSLGQYQPHRAKYPIEVWLLTKGLEEGDVRRRASINARNVRRLIAESADLRTLLAQKEDNANGSIERTICS